MTNTLAPAQHLLVMVYLLLLLLGCCCVMPAPKNSLTVRKLYCWGCCACMCLTRLLQQYADLFTGSTNNTMFSVAQPIIWVAQPIIWEIGSLDNAIDCLEFMSCNTIPYKAQVTSIRLGCSWHPAGLETLRSSSSVSCQRSCCHPRRKRPPSTCVWVGLGRPGQLLCEHEFDRCSSR